MCASASHPGHKGLDDSQWRQMEIQKDLYRWLNEKGVYINAPDWYFLDGTHKIAIGYREVNFSLPRENQKILNRQNIYDPVEWINLLWAANIIWPLSSWNPLFIFRQPVSSRRPYPIMKTGQTRSEYYSMTPGFLPKKTHHA